MNHLHRTRLEPLAHVSTWLPLALAVLCAITPGGRSAPPETTQPLAGAKSISTQPTSTTQARRPPPPNPPLPPRWAFGHIKSKDEFKGREDILRDVEWMERNDVPCEVFHIDAPWAAGHNLFEFASAKVLHSALHPETVGMRYDFGAPGEKPYSADPNDPQCRSTNPPPHVGQNLIDTLHSKGIRLTVWMTNRINNGTAFGIGRFEGQGEHEAPVFAFADKSGFLRGDMSTWHRGAGKSVDYQNPQAVAWWHHMMDKVLDMGVDGFVLDFGGKQDYVRDAFEYLRAKKGDEAIMMSRSAREVADVTLLVWAVDTKNDFSEKGIQYAVRQVIESSAKGTPFVTGTQSPHGASPTEAFVCREVQFNAFCPAQFVFCYGDLSNPWEHGPLATRVFQYYTRLHHELIPYIYSAAIRAHRTGSAIIRRAPGDLQYTFGDDLLVAPIYRDTTKRAVEFPPDSTWIDYWHERQQWSGGEHVDYQAPLDHLPLFIRPGAIIPMDVHKNWTGHGTQRSAGALTVLAYPSGRSEREYLERSSRTALRCEKRGGYDDRGDVRFELQGPERAYVLRIKTFSTPESVSGKTAGALPRRGTEEQLVENESAWCFDAASGFTVIRLPRAGEESVSLSFAKN